jgi:purine-cytosine permease-like protein
MDDQSSAAQQHHGVGEELHSLEEAFSSDDYTTSVVPLNKRRSNWRMFLTFVSLQATFPTLFAGYVARSQGLSLGQLMLAMAIASATMIVYCIGSANLGAVTGQTHTLITRTIFGRWGSGLVSLLMVIVGVGFYTFQATFVTSQLGGLFTIGSATLVAFIFCVVMMTNTLFGFKGVAGFASFVAAPIAMVWVAYAFIKILVDHPGHSLLAPPTAAPTATVLIVCGLVVGANTWGNEPDLFRYSKLRPQFNIPTLVAGYTIGAFLFPVTGYLYAVVSGTTDFGASTRFFAQSTLFGLTFLATIFFFIQAFAGNDGNLYLSTNASQNLIGNLRRWRRQYTVLFLGGAAAVVSLFFGSLSTDFFIMANLSAVTIPSASTIMVMDRFVLPRLTRKLRPTETVTPWHRTGQANWPAIVALLAATAVGGVTGGLIPGLPSFGKTITGYPALQAWVSGAVIYLVLGTLAARRANYKTLLGYPVEETERAAATAAL